MNSIIRKYSPNVPLGFFLNIHPYCKVSGNWGQYKKNDSNNAETSLLSFYNIYILGG